MSVVVAEKLFLLLFCGVKCWEYNMPSLCIRQNIKAILARMVFSGRHQSFPAIAIYAFILHDT